MTNEIEKGVAGYVFACVVFNIFFFLSVLFAVLLISLLMSKVLRELRLVEIENDLHEF